MGKDGEMKEPEPTEEEARRIWAEARRKAEAGDCDFKGRHFPEDPDRKGFAGATFKRSAWFAGAAFGGSADFEGAEAKLVSLLYPWQTPAPFQIVAEGESGYRLAKQSALVRGDYRAAGHYHYAEQCAINWGHRKAACYWPWKAAFWKKERSPLWAWGEFLVGRLLFGYGERPLRVVLAALAVILCWTGIYWIGGVITRITPEGAQIVCHGLLTSLYFSIVTFTTLGYGDLRPTELLRLAAACQAFIGAGLMALFIVALARKFTR